MTQRRDSDWFHLARTLIMDTDPMMRDLLSEILTDAGYSAVTAAHYDEGLLVAQGLQPDVTFVDMELPAEGGLRFIRALQRILPDTCIVAVTNQPTIEDAVAAVREGAYDYLRKPYNIVDVEHCVDRAVERCRLQGEVREKERFRQLSITDGLTGLYNHRHFYELLQHEVARASRYQRPLSVILLDLDDFKIYNDTHGHTVGDQLLRHAARVLKNGARNVDHVARYGGEEFAIILPETRKEGAWALARGLCEMVAKAAFSGEECLPLGRATLTAGVATFPEDGQEPIGLVARADKAMYGAKSRGKNCVALFQGEDLCCSRQDQEDPQSAAVPISGEHPPHGASG